MKSFARYNHQRNEHQLAANILLIFLAKQTVRVHVGYIILNPQNIYGQPNHEGVIRRAVEDHKTKTPPFRKFAVAQNDLAHANVLNGAWHSSKAGCKR